MALIRCTRCKQAYPASGVPYLCPACGGIYDYDSPPGFDLRQMDLTLPGMWRYRDTFDLSPNAPVVTLGEGSTPFVWDAQYGKRVGYKLEYLNPTGSYKDRGSAVLLSQLVGRGVTKAIEDSSGNAGASFAAYAARAGVQGRVFVPEYASGPKRNQIEKYGAELVRVPGPRSESARVALEEAASGSVYASHAYLPFGLPGIATIAYELWETLRRVPGTVIAPVGHGGLMLGIMRGFAALQQAGLIEHLPHYVSVQAGACAPLVALAYHGEAGLESSSEGPTVAEGVRVSRPLRARAIIAETPSGGGEVLAVEERDILPAYEALARRGLFVEPTSALAWAALQKVMGKVPEPITVILTGSGLKYQPN